MANFRALTVGKNAFMVLEIEVHSPFGPKSPVEFEHFEHLGKKFQVIQKSKVLNLRCK